ncbi:MAG: hypothetical protein FWF49_03005, partial [Oscillospiraceae bacterium]|nr:hypothetical protein [Oscillospiraceae bacterium]
KVIWDGMPNIHKIFSKQDAFLIPLGIFWIALGVAFFVVAITMVGVASNGIVMNGFLGFIGMLSCLFGLYALIGRPIYKRYWKRHTWFAVTDSRILILSKAKISEQSLWDLHKLDVSIDAKGIGTILFGREYADLNKPTFYRRNGNMAVFDFFIGNGIPDAFYDIDDARDVYHLISDLIAQ